MFFASKENVDAVAYGQMEKAFSLYAQVLAKSTTTPAKKTHICLCGSFYIPR